MHELQQQSLREQIRLKVPIEPDLWPADADPTQLEVALLHLAANAKDTMPRGGVLAKPYTQETLGTALARLRAEVQQAGARSA